MFTNIKAIIESCHFARIHTHSGIAVYLKGELIMYAREIYDLSINELETFYVHGVLVDGQWYESVPMDYSISWERDDFETMIDELKTDCLASIAEPNPPKGMAVDIDLGYGSLSVSLDENGFRSYDISTDTMISMHNGVMYILGDYLNYPRVKGRPRFEDPAEFFQIELVTDKLSKPSFIEYHLLKLDELNAKIQIQDYQTKPSTLKIELKKGN